MGTGATWSINDPSFASYVPQHVTVNPNASLRPISSSYDIEQSVYGLGQASSDPVVDKRLLTRELKRLYGLAYDNTITVDNAHTVINWSTSSPWTLSDDGVYTLSSQSYLTSWATWTAASDYLSGDQTLSLWNLNSSPSVDVFPIREVVTTSLDAKPLIPFESSDWLHEQEFERFWERFKYSQNWLPYEALTEKIYAGLDDAAKKVISDTLNRQPSDADIICKLNRPHAAFLFSATKGRLREASLRIYIVIKMVNRANTVATISAALICTLMSHRHRREPADTSMLPKQPICGSLAGGG